MYTNVPQINTVKDMKDKIIKIAQDLEKGTITETEAQSLLLGLFWVSDIVVGDTIFCDDNFDKCTYKGEYTVVEIVSFNEIILNRSDDPGNYPRINPNADFTIKRHYR